MPTPATRSWRTARPLPFTRREVLKQALTTAVAPVLSFAASAAPADALPLGGIDVSAKTLTENQLIHASAVLAGMPLFCGRYFSAVNQDKTLCDPADIELLSRYRIPLVPIARQTLRVGSQDAAAGFADAQTNVNELLRIYESSRFGTTVMRQIKARQGSNPTQKIMFFLDCESEPSLSLVYYLGWVRGLKEASRRTDINFAPAVYLPNADAASAKVIDQVMDIESNACAGLWINRFAYRPDYRALSCRPYPALQLKDRQVSISCKAKVWMHQYTECSEDFDLSHLESGVDAQELIDSLAKTWITPTS